MDSSVFFIKLKEFLFSHVVADDPEDLVKWWSTREKKPWSLNHSVEAYLLTWYCDMTIFKFNFYFFSPVDICFAVFQVAAVFKTELLNSLKDFNNSLTCFIGMSKYILLFTCDLLPLVPTVPRVNICAVGCRETSQPACTAPTRSHSSPSLSFTATPAAVDLYPGPGQLFLSEPQESWGGLGRCMLL